MARNNIFQSIISFMKEKGINELYVTDLDTEYFFHGIIDVDKHTKEIFKKTIRTKGLRPR